MTTTSNFGWTTPVATDYVRDGYQAIDTLGDAIDNTLGTVTGITGGVVPKLALDLVAVATIPSGAASVTVSNCFSSKYDNYKIIISGNGSGSTDTDLALRIGNSSSQYYSAFLHSTYGSNSALAASSPSNTDRIRYIGSAGVSHLAGTFELINPYLAKWTNIYAGSMDYAAIYSGTTTGVHAIATSYTDFTILVSSGTISGGTVRVYGYRNI